MTKGNTTWVTREVATSQKLTYATSDDHVIIKVDNVANVQLGQLRNSVRGASSSIGTADIDMVVVGPNNDSRCI